MFANIKDRFAKITSIFKSKTFLKEEDIISIVGEIRRALIEADVNIEFVKEFVNTIREKINASKLQKSLTPGSLINSIVHDELVDFIGGNIDSEEEGSKDGKSVGVEIHKRLNLLKKPSVILFVGIQGVGKTTTVAKIANLISSKNSKVSVVSIDKTRSAAMEQLKKLVENTGAVFIGHDIDLPILEIAKKSLDIALENGSDVLLIDTAGRIDIDQNQMVELQKIAHCTSPSEILLVGDAMLGQESSRIAKCFSEYIDLTGIILTRVDSDAKGGAAFSMYKATGKHIKFITTGEHISDIEFFYPSRIVSRIMGLGDISSLIDKATENIDSEVSEKDLEKFKKGKFSLSDYINYMRVMTKMGGLSSLIGMIPGMPKINDSQIENLEKKIKLSISISNSMTLKERTNPSIINGKRKIRISKGAGVSVQSVNILLKEYDAIAGTFKRMGKLGTISQMKEMTNMIKGSSNK